MNKLYFILPILAWIGCYFVWTYAATQMVMPPGTAIDTARGLWWLSTDFLAGVVTVALMMFAVIKNTP